MQLTSMEVMCFIKYDDLSNDQKKKALRAINLIKEKRNGVLKERTVADVRGQHGYVTKEESASPALHLDPFIVSLVIDAFEGKMTDCLMCPVLSCGLSSLITNSLYLSLKESLLIS